jgi:integrase
VTWQSAAAVATVPAASDLLDWRVERLTSLMGDDWLAGEWDAVRQLILPSPGGQLTRVLRCVVAGCPSDRHGPNRLCHSHGRGFDTSDIEAVQDWLASGEPGVVERRRCSEQRCAVSDSDAQGCPRPAEGPWRICDAHLKAWTTGRARGVTFEVFLAHARPLPDLGPCAATCCYLGVMHSHSGLCEIHYQAWRRADRPTGRAFTSWTARVRQPVNSRVLSLRGLPTLLRVELLYSIGCRAADQVSVVTGGMRPWVDQLRGAGAGSVTEFDLSTLDDVGDAHHVRFARYSVDRVRLAYADADAERLRDVWDLRLFGVPGKRRRLDFTPIRQHWLREATKAWTATTTGQLAEMTLRHRVGSVAVLSAVLAAGPGGAENPEAMTRADVERFLARIHSPGFRPSQRPFGTRARVQAVEECALMIREARSLGLLPTLGATFAFRRGDSRRRTIEEGPGRALPEHVVAQLDNRLELLKAVPGCTGPARRATLGALGERAGDVAVLAYLLLKATGRRVGEVTSLRLDCLDVDEYGKDVLVYDNHKAARMNRRLPLADSQLVAAIRIQQEWVSDRFAHTPRERLWLLPRPHKNFDGSQHLSGHQILTWIHTWVDRIPQIDAGPLDPRGEPVPFNRAAIHPHALRHTYAQTLADQGVAPSVLRDLMDHRSMTTTLAYYRVGDSRKRAAMEALARHTVDNRGVTRPVHGESSQVARLNEQLSWVAVPMGKCSEPSNIRAGGQACPIRYQCAGCAHFESDPSYLPELRAHADDLRREREVMLAAGAADWVTDGVTRQLDVIAGHVRTHEELLESLPHEQRTLIQEASATVRKARQSVPVAFGQRLADGHG